MRDFRSSRMFWYATKTDVLSPSDSAYPLLKASPTGSELQELFTPNLFELGFAGQNTRQPIPRLASPDSARRHGRLHCCPIAERRGVG